MIASALKRLLDKHIHSRKRASVEEQRAEKYNRFSRGRQIAYMIYEHFRATGACEALQGFSDLFNFRLQNDDVQYFDVRRDQALLSTSYMPSDVILEGLQKSKLQDSVQLQTVLALYDQETVRNNGQTSYSRFKTSVKLHIDQLMRTRNFRVRSEAVERGAVTKSQKGKRAYVEKKVGQCFQWKAHGQCSKGDSCIFSHDRQAQGDLCGSQRRKGDRPLPHQIGRPRLTARERHLQKHQATEMKALQTKGTKIRAVTKIVKPRHIVFGILPCVKTTSLRPDAHLEEHVSSDMLRRRRSPATSQRKEVRKDQLHYCRSLHKILIRDNLFFVKKESWDQNTPSNSPRTPGTKLKIGKEMVHRKELSKSVNVMSAVLARQNSMKDHMRRPCTKKDAPAE